MIRENFERKCSEFIDLIVEHSDKNFTQIHAATNIRTNYTHFYNEKPINFTASFLALNCHLHL